MASGVPTKQDILLLYNGSDSESWKQYFLDLIHAGLNDIRCDTVDIDSDEINTITDYMNQYHMLTVLVSPKMMDTLELEADSIKGFINAQKHVAVIRLCVDQYDLEHVVKSEYRNTDTWTMTEISTDEKENQKMIAVLMDRLQSVMAPPKPTPRTYSETEQHSHSSSSIIKTICPDEIKTTGENVILVLKQTYEHKTIQVTVGENEQKIDTKRLSPYCYQFKSPVHQPGKVVVRVFIDGVKSSKIPIKYTKPSTFAYTCPEYLCQVLNVGEEDLDKTLTRIFQSSTPDDSSLQYILSPKNVMGSIDALFKLKIRHFGHPSTIYYSRLCLEPPSFESRELTLHLNRDSLLHNDKISDEVLPTLLHFACYYGLQELCSCVMDMPGSQFVFRIKNCDEKTPLQLAKDNDHEDLAEYIEAFLEMQDYIEVCEDIYEKMTNQSLEGYMYMKGGNRDVVEPYDEGRIAPGQEDGYILTDRDVRDSVSEVTEEEDVLAKPRIPDRSTKPKPQKDLFTLPKRTVPPPPIPEKSPVEPPMPRDDDFFKPIPLPTAAMGSSTVAELIDYQEMFKDDQVDLGDIERLYQAWIERNKANQTASIKQRRERLEQMKKEYNCKPLKQKTEKIGLISRLTAKRCNKSDVQDLDIRHPVEQNKYMDIRQLSRRDHEFGNRDSYGSNRDSVSSTTSTSSWSSRDSGLDPIRERSDSEPEEPPPPVPRRTRDNSLSKSANRDSLGKQFLDNLEGRASRLPPVPPLHPTIRKVKSDAKQMRPPERRKISH